MLDITPIALFTYNRPDLLARTLACLRENNVPKIYAFSDGARAARDVQGVNEVRAMLRAVDWCDISLIERRINLGLGKSITLGVSEVLNQHESVIVFEDDLICVPGTYDYLCTLLRHYADSPKVMSVTGWTHPLVTPKDVGNQPYLDGRAECWVWGTWRRAWQGITQTDALSIVDQCRAKGVDPNCYGHDLIRMAKIEHAKNIWAVRWLYWHIVQNGLCARPPYSLVEHIGDDKRATNATNNGIWANPPLRKIPPLPNRFATHEHPECKNLWQQAYPSKRHSVFQRIKNAVYVGYKELRA